MIVPPEVAVTCFQVALKPFLTTLESLWNLTVRLLALLMILSGLLEPHFFTSCLWSLSSTEWITMQSHLASYHSVFTFNKVVSTTRMVLNLELNKFQLNLAPN